MKTYDVGVWETVGGYFEIEADSQEEAEAIVEAHVSNYGINEPLDGQPIDVTHRDLQICDCIQRGI